ncbi:APC family permease [Bradyrhizobium sp. CCBAU 53421]|uniref:APC family permease n=1 Tax=Bradyrhizobium sp. CCBAU 53421 TaxID=1325120 RepID=UPI00188CED6E|nr:amino acid permease [Bradyrhizobium sp. CCBAU 53421]
MKDESQSGIKGHLELSSGILLVVSVILGSGILVLPGMVFERIGSDGIYAWLACSLLTTPILATMVMLGRAYPSAGGVAYYAKLAFGQYFELLVALLFLGAAMLGLPSIAIVGAAYLQKLIGTSVDIHLLAVLFILLCGFLALSGGKSLSRVVRLVGGSSLFLLIGVLFVLIVLAVRANGAGFSRPASFSSIVGQIPLIFFSFTGWEIVSHLAADFRTPGKTLGRAMVCSFFVVFCVYIGSAALVHVADIKSNFNTPILQAAVQIAPAAPGWLVALLGVLLIAANLFGSVVAVSRLILYLSGRRVLSAGLSYVRNGAPRNSVYFVAVSLTLIVACDWIELLDIEIMFRLAAMNFLAIYVISAIALVRLRQRLFSRLLAAAVVCPSALIMLSSAYSLSYVALIALMTYFLTRNNRTRST